MNWVSKALAHGKKIAEAENPPMIVGEMASAEFAPCKAVKVGQATNTMLYKFLKEWAEVYSSFVKTNDKPEAPPSPITVSQAFAALKAHGLVPVTAHQHVVNDYNHQIVIELSIHMVADNKASLQQLQEWIYEPKG